MFAYSQTTFDNKKTVFKFKTIQEKTREINCTQFDFKLKPQLISQQNKPQNYINPLINYSNYEQNNIKPTIFVLSGLIKYSPALKFKW